LPEKSGVSASTAVSGHLSLIAAVRQVVAVDGSQHDVFEVHQLDRAGRVLDLLGVEPAARVTRVDGAKLTRARANGAHEHQRGRAVVPALADVRTDRFFAHGSEPVRTHRRAQILEALAARQSRFQPRRLRLSRRGAPIVARLDSVLDRREALLGLVFGAGRDDADAAELVHPAC
jgi:hypothetical protein